MMPKAARATWLQMPNYPAAGYVILKHIKAAGMTPCGFAKVIGISESVIGPVCKGTYHLPQYLSFDMWHRIAHGLYPRDRMARQAFNRELMASLDFIDDHDASLSAAVIYCASILNDVGRVAFRLGRARDRRKRIAAPPAPSAEPEQA